MVKFYHSIFAASLLISSLNINYSFSMDFDNMDTCIPSLKKEQESKSNTYLIARPEMPPRQITLNTNIARSVEKLMIEKEHGYMIAFNLTLRLFDTTENIINLIEIIKENKIKIVNLYFIGNILVCLIGLLPYLFVRKNLAPSKIG